MFVVIRTMRADYPIKTHPPPHPVRSRMRGLLVWWGYALWSPFMREHGGLVILLRQTIHCFLP